MQIQRCIGCMEEITAYPCPNCGYDPQKETHNTSALPPQTILNGRYLVGKVLGQGGFGITYIGLDLVLNTRVAIKEYFPNGQAVRVEVTGNTVNWGTAELARSQKQAGIEAFLKEARKMARITNIPNVVNIRDLFSENDTAYIVMEYIEGETLSAYLNKTGPLTWEQARAIFLPAVSAMEQVHKAGLIHRDLSPDNLMLQPDGTVKILDLGAAKDLNVNSGASSMVVAKSGFSPVEQYTQRGNSGPWTDVYAMAATMYYALTGCLPPNSIDRVEEDTIDWGKPGLRALPPKVLAAMKAAMEISAKKRMQDMAPLKAAMEAAKPAPAKKPKEKKPAPPKPQRKEPAPKPQEPKAAPAKKKGSPGLIIGIAAAVLAVVVGAIALGGGKADYEDAYLSIQPGTHLTFGSYEQDNDLANGAEPIEWLVLDRNGSKALVISRYGLDAVPYNTEKTVTTWEKCSLRTWLNQDFLSAAFTGKEQKAILLTDVDNSKSQGYSGWSTDGGNNTQDKVFLLSYAEANEYFGAQDYSISGAQDNTKSRVEPTAYAIAKGAYTSDSNKTADGAAAGWWWLRSPGLSQRDAAYILYGGSLRDNHVRSSDGCVRPAFWINLDSGIF